MNSQGLNAPAIVVAVLCALLAAGAVFALPAPFGIAVGGALILSGALVPMSLLMAKQWERAVVLRAGSSASGWRFETIYFMPSCRQSSSLAAVWPSSLTKNRSG